MRRASRVNYGEGGVWMVLARGILFCPHFILPVGWGCSDFERDINTIVVGAGNIIY